MRADVALGAEASTAEKGMEDRSQRAHGQRFLGRASRSLASASSSGTDDEYQSVSFGSRWPMKGRECGQPGLRARPRRSDVRRQDWSRRSSGARHAAAADELATAQRLQSRCSHQEPGRGMERALAQPMAGERGARQKTPKLSSTRRARPSSQVWLPNKSPMSTN